MVTNLMQAGNYIAAWGSIKMQNKTQSELGATDHVV